MLFALAGSDPDGDPITQAIDFGDGASAEAASAVHAYAAPGTYYVRGRGVDGFGLATEDTITVRVVAGIIGCMDSAASNYDPNANLPGDCTYGPTLVKMEEMTLQFVCDYERDFVQYQTVDTWGRLYDHWSDGTRTPAGDPYEILFETRNLGPVGAAPYGLTCDTYHDDAWP